jgi:type II secretory pathway pseudopilin PulG
VVRRTQSAVTPLVPSAAQAVHVTVNNGDDRLIIGAAILTALATIALAIVAVCQIRAGQKQAQSAARQARRAFELARTQADAASRIASETREAAERQWQPRVFARKSGGVESGDGRNAAPDEWAVPCYLVNEGTGPAFNIEVGIEAEGKFHPWEGGPWWALQAQEFFPPLDPAGTRRVPSTPIHVGVKVNEWADDYVIVSRFENLLEERFEVRTYPDPNRPSEFRRL